MAIFKMKYWPVKSRGWAIFLLAELANDEIVLEEFKWPDDKKETPFGQLPLITFPDTGFKMAQSYAQINLFARRAGLLGETDKEFAIGQMLLGEHDDVWTRVLGKAQYAEDGVKAWKECETEWIPQHFTYLENLLKEDTHTFTGKYLVGEYAMWGMVNVLLSLFPDALDKAKWPKLAKFYDDISNMPKIKAFCEKWDPKLSAYYTVKR